MDRLEQLAARHLDELLSPAERRELGTLIASDAASAARLAELYALHRRLEELYSAAAPKAIAAILADIAGKEADFVESVLPQARTERPQRVHQGWTWSGEMLP